MMDMFGELGDRIDFSESGNGPTIVLVPGSCSTGSAWRSVIAAWESRFRCVTTSLLGYGATAERRSQDDPSVAYEAEMLEAVISRAGGRVHLVGHSFGALVGLAVALRNKVRLASLTILEAPAPQLLQVMGEDEHYRAIRCMTDAYFQAFEDGNAEAIAGMIDFYGGAGTFASWPPRVRDYAVETTPVNMLDWAGAYGFAPSAKALAGIEIPVLVAWGGLSHPAMRRIGTLLGEYIGGATVAEIDGAAHFMIATHASQTADLLARHVAGAEATTGPTLEEPASPP